MTDAAPPALPPLPAEKKPSSDPLHGVTLQALLEQLVAHYGWPELAHQLPVRCFTHDASVASSLKFLRKTPWARSKVEGLYVYMLRQQAQQQARSLAREKAKLRDEAQAKAQIRAPAEAPSSAQHDLRPDTPPGAHR